MDYTQDVIMTACFFIQLGADGKEDEKIPQTQYKIMRGR
tara:strand:- start:785 stop:901 length:117 start_codon:yes stop_codon:yes gene_type:complete